MTAPVLTHSLVLLLQLAPYFSSPLPGKILNGPHLASPYSHILTIIVDPGITMRHSREFPSFQIDNPYSDCE